MENETDFFLFHPDFLPLLFPVLPSRKLHAVDMASVQEVSQVCHLRALALFCTHDIQKISKKLDKKQFEIDFH